jgi:tetratricopeptide (TPR) repeat protein
MYSLADHPMDARILVCFHGLMFYAWKTLAPFSLLPLYELHIPMDTSQSQFVLAMIVVGVVGLGTLTLLFVRRLPGVVVAAICYAAFLGPVLGLFQNGPQIVADRYAYLPSIGLMMALAGGVAWWLMRPRERSNAGLRWAALAIGVGVVLALGSATWQQSKVWRSSESLWTYQLQHDPDSAVGNMNLGLIIARHKQQPADAVPYFRRAVQRDPHSKKYRQNLRMALREAGLFNELVQAWLDEAALFAGSPSFEYTAQWHLDAGTQALVKEQHNLALEHLTVSVSLDDQQPLALSNLGVALERLQQWDAAKAAYRRAIELDPRLPNPRVGLALMLSREGKQAEAIREAESLVQINPNDANAKSLLAQLRAAQK